MGQYVINGEVVDLRGDRPTALDLKHAAGKPTDWVMANMPSGQVRHLPDTEVLPADACDLSIVTPFTYGC